jgi:hypothetical protein
VSRGAKLAIAAVVAVVALNVALSLLHSLLGGTPGGPASSTYATGPSGAAAYAALLARDGHPIERLREPPAAARLAPASTVILLDPQTALAPADADALRRFASAGGRLLLGGATGSWLARIVTDPPAWSPAGAGVAGTLAPLSELAGVTRVGAAASGSWQGGSALPLLGAGERALLSLAAVGAGQVWLLADAAPLQNRELGSADDAALGLALAGPRGRPVVFLESYHGYGSASGYAAIPARWWLAFALLFIAALTLMLASGRRLGPPQASERQLPPARWEYVESLAGILERSRRREEAIRPLRARLGRVIAERVGLGQAPSDAELGAAARLLGVPEGEAGALSRPAATDADVVALGRALVRVSRQSRS